MKTKAPRNRTLLCSNEEVLQLSQKIIRLNAPTKLTNLENQTINQNIFEAVPHLPPHFVDLLLLDPPYNISKNYNGHLFREKEKDDYQKWFSSIIQLTKHTLKPSATIYVCSDWKTSLLIAPILEEHFFVRNRITWEREKGRGAKSNWKNNTEDIWFCTQSEDFYFNVEAVKLKRKVVAPYRDLNGNPKDWQEEEDGNFRLTYPSNIWSDITIPFWSMPENTDHPTQKPEKLIAKLILASTKANDFVFDPFLGSGTTSVVSKKLNRKYLGIEQNTEYCCWAEKRLEMANSNSTIQGYDQGVFWERNSLNEQNTKKNIKTDIASTLRLFDE